MSVIFCNILKSEKSHFCQWKSQNDSPVLLKVAVLVHLAKDGEDGIGLQLEKVGPAFQVLALCLRKIDKN